MTSTTSTKEPFIVYGWEIPYKYVLAFLKRNNTFSCVQGEQCMCGMRLCWSDLVSVVPKFVDIVSACSGSREYSKRQYYVTLLKKGDRQHKVTLKELDLLDTDFEIKAGRDFVAKLREDYLEGKGKPLPKFPKKSPREEEGGEDGDEEEEEEEYDNEILERDDDDFGEDLVGEIGDPKMFIVASNSCLT